MKLTQDELFSILKSVQSVKQDFVNYHTGRESTSFYLRLSWCSCRLSMYLPVTMVRAVKEQKAAHTSGNILLILYFSINEGDRASQLYYETRLLSAHNY